MVPELVPAGIPNHLDGEKGVTIYTMYPVTAEHSDARPAAGPRSGVGMRCAGVVYQVRVSGQVRVVVGGAG